MKIRSVTLFANPGSAITDPFLDFAGGFAKQARELSEAHQFDLQTLRFASPPFPQLLSDLSNEQKLNYAVHLEQALNAAGFEYISLGPALPSCPESYQLVPELIQATESSFFSGLMTEASAGVSLHAVNTCGEIIERLARLEPDGFANLYFAALGHVPPGSPFFPAAYHDASKPAFAFAVEGADLAVDAFKDCINPQDARKKLTASLEDLDRRLGDLGSILEKTSAAKYTGADYSLAPFPEKGSSLGNALEKLGVQHLGDHGSLAAAAFLADSIDRAEVNRTGFSGLMLPVLEDSVLAERAAEGSLTIKDLLLFSAVCGTGLDTVPLPGSSTAKQISAVLLDLAALSLRLDKPLTARLMPIPGKKAGDETNFDFAFFANSKVMEIHSKGISGHFQGEGYLDILPR